MLRMPTRQLRFAPYGLPLVVGLACALAMVALVWQSSRPAPALRVPGLDGGVADGAGKKPLDISGTLQTFASADPAVTPVWPGFRGALRDGVHTEALSYHWPSAGPKVRWRVPMLGPGYAGPVVAQGRVLLLDYDPKWQNTGGDVLRCWNIHDGQELWRRGYTLKTKSNHGVSRTVPMVVGDVVITLGPKLHLMAVDIKSGAYLWGLDLCAQYQARVPEWYAGQCLLADDGKLLVAVGGKVLMLALDPQTGKVLWQLDAPAELTGWEQTHASLTPLTLAGQRMYVACYTGGVAGISNDGTLLWTYPGWRIPQAVVASPVVVGEDHLLLAGGYGAGAQVIKVALVEDHWQVQRVHTFTANEFGAEQHTPIAHDGHVYGVVPGGEMVCLDPLTATRKWSSGAVRFGLGPYFLAGDSLWALDDRGRLTVMAARPDSFSVRAQARLLQGHESWAPMAVSGRGLIVRDLDEMVCYDLPEGP